MKTREDVIFSCTDSLFKVSQEIYDINKDISNSLLFICDRLLKEIEVADNSDTRTKQQDSCLCKNDDKKLPERGISDDIVSVPQEVKDSGPGKVQSEIRSLINEIREGL